METGQAPALSCGRTEIAVPYLLAMIRIRGIICLIYGQYSMVWRL